MAQFTILDSSTNEPYLALSWAKKADAQAVLDDLLSPYEEGSEYHKQFKIIKSYKVAKQNFSTGQGQRIKLYSSISEDEKILLFAKEKVKNIIFWDNKSRSLKEGREEKDFDISIDILRLKTKPVIYRDPTSGYKVSSFTAKDLKSIESSKKKNDLNSLLREREMKMKRIFLTI